MFKEACLAPVELVELSEEHERQYDQCELESAFHQCFDQRRLVF